MHRHAFTLFSANRETILRGSLALAAMFALSTPAAAQTWIGSNPIWHTSSNWSPAVVPNSTTAEVNFAGDGIFYAVTISSNVSAKSLSFSNPTLGYSLTSSPGVSLSGVTEINVGPGVTGVQTINLANVPTGSLFIPISEDLTITNNSTAVGTSLVIGPNTRISALGLIGSVVVTGAGTTQISGSFNSGSSYNAVRKEGPGTLILSNPTNGYYGGTIISDGKLLLAAGTAIPTNSSVFVGGGQFDIGSLSNTAATAIGSLVLGDTGTFRVPSGSGDYHLNFLWMTGGTVNFAGTSNFWLHFRGPGAGIRTLSSSTTATWIGSGVSRIQNDTGAPMTIDVEPGTTPSGIDLDAGIILSSGGGNPTFVKDGAGTMRLTNPGNTANINLVDGKLRVDDMAHLGTGIITLNGGTLQYGGPDATTTKSLTTAGAATISVSTPGVNLNYSGIMNQSSYTILYVLGPGAGSAPSTLTLANNNNYAGLTFVYDNAILAIPTISNFGQPSPIGSDPLNLGVSLGTADSRGTLLLTGTSPLGYSTNRMVALNGLYLSGGGGAFGVQNADTIQTLSGQISGSGSLIKTDPGGLFLGNTSNNYAGGTYVDAGRLRVNSDAVLGAALVRVNADGILRYNLSATVGRSIILAGGTLEAPGGIDLAAAGALQGEGTVVGNVANSGSVVPDGSTGLLHVEGSYTQSSSGRLSLFADLFLPPGNNPRLDVTGDVALDGTLEMNLGGMGQFRGTRTFDILDWGGNLSGTFSTLQLPMFGGAFVWDTSQLYISGVLTLIGPPLEGDYNLDGTVDAADYTVWRDSLGSTMDLAADGDASGTVDAGDYDIWKMHFGDMLLGGGAGSGSALPSADSLSAAVPEPASLVLFALVGLFAGLVVVRRNQPLLTIARMKVSLAADLPPSNESIT